MKKKKLKRLLKKILKQPTAVEKQLNNIFEWLRKATATASPGISAGTGMEENPNYCSDICDSCRQILDRRWSKQSDFLICSPESAGSVQDSKKPEDLSVSATARSTSTRKPPTKQCTTRKVRCILVTQEQSIRQKLETLISLLQDSLASPIVALGDELHSKTQEVLCSLKLQDSLKPSDLRFFSLKTYPDCYRLTRGKISKSSLKHFPTWGIYLNGWCLTAPNSVCRNKGGGSTLSDILEKNVPAEYSLSEVAMRKLLSSSFPDRKDQEFTIPREQLAPNAQDPAAEEEKQDFTS